jgi:hypothetical protein
MTVNDEQGRMHKVAATAYFKIISKYLCVSTEESHGYLQSRLNLRPVWQSAARRHFSFVHDTHPPGHEMKLSQLTLTLSRLQLA